MNILSGIAAFFLTISLVTVYFATRESLKEMDKPKDNAEAVRKMFEDKSIKW